MSISKLGAQIHADPELAKSQILGAIEETEGDRKAAAVNLGTTHRSLYRYIERLDLWDAIDALIEQRGFQKIPGPPRTGDRIRDAILATGGSLTKAAATLDMPHETLERRIGELNLWDDLNRRLEAVGKKPMKRPVKSATQRGNASA